MEKKTNLCEGKKYNSGWQVSLAQLTLTKKEGHGRDKQGVQLTLNEARRQFFAACNKYGDEARKLAVENLKESLQLFGAKGEGWVQGTEEEVAYDKDDEPVMQYCAIGAIHKANGQAEYLARLATNLAAGELFPGRAGISVEWTYGDEDSFQSDLPDVVSFNDDDMTKFPDVKLVFKRAIELLA